MSDDREEGDRISQHLMEAEALLEAPHPTVPDRVRVTVRAGIRFMREQWLKLVSGVDNDA